MSYTFPRAALTEAINAAYLDSDARTRDSYDGRGSYGRSAFGVVVPTMQDALRLVAAMGAVCGAALEADDESDWLGLLEQMMTDAHMDNMGHDMILYFNGWQLTD